MNQPQHPTRISARLQPHLVAIATPLMLLAATSGANAATTGFTGGNQPIDNLQPYAATNYIISTEGIYPPQNSGSGCGLGNICLGQVSAFAGNFTPIGWLPADGRLLQISQNSALFSLLGTTYGGDGRSTFALPDLRGRTAIGTGQGAGLSSRTLGEQIGTETETLTEAQIPSHTHPIPGSITPTGATGGGQPHNNVQPSLGLTYAIATQGTLGNCGSSSTSCLAEIGTFANNFVPRGWLPADGRLLQISQNSALFSLLGTTYGGDGRSTFALPDLRGRTAIGSGQGAGLSSRTLGEQIGTETETLTEAQLPSHTHTLPAPQNATGATGGSQPRNNVQPSLALTYAIATQGLFPPRSPGSTNCGDGNVCIGQVGLFAFSDNFLTNNNPGWLPADGRLLSISQNTALFSILGTTYGGDGRSTFRLPDFRGRTALGVGQGTGLSLSDLGEFGGIESNAIDIAQLPSHNHSFTATAEVPEPAGIFGTILGGAIVGKLILKRRKQLADRNF